MGGEVAPRRLRCPPPPLRQHVPQHAVADGLEARAIDAAAGRESVEVRRVRRRVVEVPDHVELVAAHRCHHAAMELGAGRHDAVVGVGKSNRHC